MNHITALAVARSIQQDRLEAARRHRSPRPVKPTHLRRRSHLGDMLRVLFASLRHKPHPIR